LSYRDIDSSSEYTNLCVIKNYGDFKYLNEFVKASNIDLENGKYSFPVFP